MANQLIDEKPKTIRRIVERVPLAWLYLPLLFISAISAFGGSWSPQTTGAGRLAFAVAVGGIVSQVFHWKAARGSLVALAIIYSTAALSLIKVSFVLLILVGPLVFLVPSSAVLIFPLLVLTVPLAVVTCVFVLIELGRKWTIGTIVVAVVLTGAIPTSISTDSQSTRSWRAFEPNKLAPDMDIINKCAHQYAALHPASGFPGALNQLGSGGNGCLPDALLARRYKGYEITYEPRSRDALGRIPSYRVQAIENPRGEDYAMISSEETGLVFFSYPGPRGGGSPYLVAPAQGFINSTISCLQEAHPGPDVINKPASAEGRVHHCLEYYEISEAGRKAASDLFSAEYDFEYGPFAVTGFTLQVRPRVYGIGGIRSYLIEASHIPCDDRVRVLITAHVTPEDRAATISDPAPDRREFKIWNGCQ